MYTVNKLQKDLEKARENLREVEDHIQKVDGKSFISPTRYNNKQEVWKDRFTDSSDKDKNDLTPGRKRIVSSDPRKDLRENLSNPAYVKDNSKNFRGGRNRNNDDDFLVKKPKLSEDDLMFNLKRFREQRDFRPQGNVERRSDEEYTKTVFSRLSGPGAHEEFMYEEEFENKDRKPSVLSRVIPAEEPSRAEVLAAQRNTDEKSKQRNRRMFGALVGTLQQFRRDETRTKDREATRQRINEKLEEEELKEKERLQNEKRNLLVERKRREVEIKRIEWSLNRVKEFSAWETNVSLLHNFIRTQTKPHIFYLPKVHNETTEELLVNSQEVVKDMIANRLKNLNDEIENSEKKSQRSLTGEGCPLDGGDKENLDDDPENEPLSKPNIDAMEEVQEGEWEEAEKQQVWQEHDGSNNAVDIPMPDGEGPKRIERIMDIDDSLELKLETQEIPVKRTDEPKGDVSSRRSSSSDTSSDTETK